MSNATKNTHVRIAPKLHFTDFKAYYTLNMTPIMLTELANFLGDSHVRTDTESVWYCEAYDDERGFLAPFTVHSSIDDQWVECDECDATFIANACAKEVWSKSFAPENLVIATLV